MLPVAVVAENPEQQPVAAQLCIAPHAIEIVEIEIGDVDHIEADYADGVLTLRIPVAEKAKPRKIAINTTAPVVDVGDLAEPAEAE